jgi:putative acetyltransferase
MMNHPRRVIRAATDADAAGVSAVESAAFGTEGPVIVELIEALTTHSCGRDGLSFVADEDGRIVGHALVTRNRLDTLAATIDVAVLSPIGVDPSQQGRGIGRSLVAQCVAAAAVAGFPAIFLEGDPSYYSRLGFMPAKPLGFRKPSLRIPDDAFQVILLPGYADHMTGTLVYAQPFWNLDCVGQREPALPDRLVQELRAGRNA